MKLPDFIKFSEFNILRDKMGAPLLETIAFKQDINRLSIVELEILASKGIDILSKDINILDDGTLAYKDRRIIIYIRDIMHFNKYGNSMPKFHLANCTTLQSMRSGGRFSRYVGSIRTDGIFEVNQFISGRKENQNVKLNVCKNCLGYLNYKNYLDNKNSIFQEFQLKEFFKIYPTDFHRKPIHTNATAPLNEYSNDWQTISYQKRTQVNWCCEKCGTNLNDKNLRKYLHVHHKDGSKHNNRQRNLQALCINCHANEPFHSHMKETPDFKKFNSLTAQ